MNVRYKFFCKHTGLRVSEIALGCGMFGTTWGYGAERAEARRMFDGYAEAGGNFLDTADTYQRGESETLLGEFVARDRDTFVISTKYSLGANDTPSVATTGNSRKNMVRSVEKSLRRLKTDYIDLYWVHMPDEVTEIEEIMRGFDALVRSGKILYAGLSNFPAWRVAHASTLAALRGWAPLIGVQVEYSLVERAADREIVPMSAAHGLGIAGWSPLGGGLLTGKYRRGERGRATTWSVPLIHAENNEQRGRILDSLEAIAGETNSNAGRVAIAWVSAKGIIPIIGPRTREQLDDNLAAATVQLSDDHIRRLDEVSAIPLGYPHDFFHRFPDVWNDLAAGQAAIVEVPREAVA
jgi:aryl-alcohol dehydrogenase-like predicted oxidoreductase